MSDSSKMNNAEKIENGATSKPENSEITEKDSSFTERIPSKWRRRIIIGMIITLLACCLTLLLALAAISAANALFPVEGSGDVQQQDYDLDEFDRIQINVESQVSITNAASDSVQIEADDNILSNLNVRVRGQTLVIEPSNDFPFILGRSLDATEPININIAMNDLERITTSGKVSVEITELTVEEMRVSARGESLYSLENVNIEDLQVDLSGESEFSGTGVLNEQRIDISGSGFYDTENATSKSVSLEISGAGTARINVEEELKISISGSGEVFYKGDPNQLDQDISGSGKVEKISD
jgi:hypothetical protein